MPKLTETTWTDRQLKMAAGLDALHLDDCTPMNTLSLRSLQGPPTSMDVLDSALRKASASSRIDSDIVSRNAQQHYLAAQAAIQGRENRKAQRAEWAAAAMGMVWLLASVGGLVATFGAYVCP